MHRIILKGHDRPPQSSAGGNSVTGLEPIQHGLPLFLAPLLGKNQKKIKDAEDENQRRNAEPSHPTAELQCQKLRHMQEVEADESAKNSRAPNSAARAVISPSLAQPTLAHQL
jgi:hypothetical protein